MARKDFKTLGTEELSPAMSFISSSPAPELTEQPKAEPIKETVKEVKPKAVTTPKKEETKSKRLNLLVKPSILDDVTKIAFMQKTSVNNLINDLLTEYRDAHRDQIDKYNSIF